MNVKKKGITTVELLKEEDRNTLLLEDMRKNSIWVKVNDKNKTEINLYR